VAAHGKTPWEAFWGEKPGVGHTRVFGARAYIHVPKELRKKLDMVSERGTFVGYKPNAKAYRVLRERDGRILASRDVLFDETVQPAKATANEFELNGRTTEPATAEKKAGTEIRTREKSAGTGQGSTTEARVTEQRNLGRVTTRSQARQAILDLRDEPDNDQAEAEEPVPEFWHSIRERRVPARFRE
jgi:hypothetical protein